MELRSTGLKQIYSGLTLIYFISVYPLSICENPENKVKKSLKINYMVISVDAGCLGINEERLKVGVYQIAVHLFRRLKELDKTNTYLLYSFEPIDDELLQTFGENVKNIVVTPSKGWMKVWVPMQILRDNPDVFLGLTQAIPQKIPHITNYQTIVLFHDIAFEKYPTMYSYSGSLDKLHEHSKYAAENADKIISVSTTTKKDLQTQYNIPTNKIDVIHPGVDEVFGENVIPYLSKKPYFLFVGAFKKIKNVPGIIQGFQYFSEQTGLEYELMLVGGDKWFDSDIAIALQRLPQRVSKQVKMMGFVDDTLLRQLYAGALAFVSPSFYEGFGLTFVEAMASGIPVIGSTHGSIPEIVWDCGILVNPRDPKAIGDAMVRIANDARLREQLKIKSKERAKAFSWETFAKEVLKIITIRHYP